MKLKDLYFSAKQYRIPLILYGLAWANLNSGFWNFRDISGPVQMFSALRAAIAYVLPLIGLIYWNRAKALKDSLNPVYWLAIYGWVALFASVFSPSFEAAFYFGMAFMMNALVVGVFFSGGQRNSTQNPEQVLLYATWAILGIFVLMIYFFARGSLAEGYNGFGGSDSVAGETVSRSSGMARFFGVAGLLCFARLWHGRARLRYLFALPMAFCAWVVWSMQSRGGMFGFFAGMVFLFFLSRSSWRAYALAAVAALSFFCVATAGQQSALVDKVVTQVQRGQNTEELVSMTGRTNFYELGIQQIIEHPVFGQGNWADRMTIGGHVHNTYLQALMNAGVVGFVPFMMSWILGWYLFYQIYQRRKRLSKEDQQLFMEAAAVMMFFTVRSIPETTTASFSVDSMLMVPVYCYLAMLYRRMRNGATSLNGGAGKRILLRRVQRSASL